MVEEFLRWIRGRPVRKIIISFGMMCISQKDTYCAMFTIVPMRHGGRMKPGTKH